jgi:hypothetical protein
MATRMRGRSAAAAALLCFGTFAPGQRVPTDPPQDVEVNVKAMGSSCQPALSSSSNPSASDNNAEATFGVRARVLY